MKPTEEAPYFWRIIISENGKEKASGQGTEKTGTDAMFALVQFLQVSYLKSFPHEDGTTIEIKTIFEKITRMEE